MESKKKNHVGKMRTKIVGEKKNEIYRSVHHSTTTWPSKIEEMQ